MRWLVLGLWILTVLTGTLMLLKFLSRGGLTNKSLDTMYPAALFANFSLGSAAFLLWIMFLATGVHAVAWAAFAQFLAVVLIGTVLALHGTGREKPATRRRVAGASRHSLTTG